MRSPNSSYPSVRVCDMPSSCHVTQRFESAECAQSHHSAAWQKLRRVLCAEKGLTSPERTTAIRQRKRPKLYQLARGLLLGFARHIVKFVDDEPAAIAADE